MKVHETIDIAAPPQIVWAQVADPQAMADWHVKLVEVRRTTRGPLYVGERFGTTYVMSRKKQNRQNSEAEVLHCDPWSTLVLRHHMLEPGRTGYVDETYHLLPRGEGRETCVEHTVDFAKAGLPIWARALMWCITRTGEPRGEGVLDPLKRACETNSASPTDER